MTIAAETDTVFALLDGGGLSGNSRFTAKMDPVQGATCTLIVLLAPEE